MERNRGGRTDPDKIENLAERQFFILSSRLLQEKMPGATIVHEPTLFKVQSNPYKMSGTIPDFLITRPMKKNLCGNYNVGQLRNN